MLVDNANIYIDETFKKLELSPKQIADAKQMHQKALEIDAKIGGGIDKKIYVNRRRKGNRTKKIKGGSGIGSALKLSGYIVSYYYLSHISFWYRAGFGFAWMKIVDVLDKYIDGKILDNTILTIICEFIAYLLPLKLIEYFIFVATKDATILAADTAKQLAADLAKAKTMAFSSNPYFITNYDFTQKISTPPFTPNPDLTTNPSVNLTLPTGKTVVEQIKGMFMSLYDLAKTSVINHPYLATGIVLSLPIIAFMGYYLKIRVSGNKDKNLDLDKTIYMNHKRRILIMKAQMRKASKKEDEIRREEKEYDLKLKEQIEEGKKEEHIEESKKRKKQWHKFVKRGFDDNELYQQNDFLTDTKRSTRRKNKVKDDDKDDDKTFLENYEQHLSNKS